MTPHERIGTETNASYSGIAKLFHWAVVVLLTAQYTVAWTMPAIHSGTVPETLITLHLSLGVLIILVMTLRLLWRLTHPAPPPMTGLPAWRLLSSRVTHGALYLLLFMAPLLGWMNASARGWPVTLFALFRLPALLAEGSPLGRTAGDIHVWTTWAILVFAGLHILGALYHRFVLRDAVLMRMLPRG
jgi:cytochrome b561